MNTINTGHVQTLASPLDQISDRYAGLRVAVAHDWLVAYNGSERVVEQILTLFPKAGLYSTIMNPAALPEVLSAAQTSFLQRLPGAAAHHEWLIPLMPAAWRLQKKISDVDVVISSSHACAKAVRVASHVPHICYCHTPMRYAWDFNAEASRFPAFLRPVVRIGMGGFRRWDRRASNHVTEFVANSTSVAGRIAAFYGRGSHVVHPPVRTEFFTPGEQAEDFFLFVGRLTGYKRPDIVVDAFSELRQRLVVVGQGPMAEALKARAGPNVTFLSTVSDEKLRSLYRRAQALVFLAEEDFGITMAEAQCCGTPVIGLDRGGAVDIVRPGTTGILINQQSPAAVSRAVRHFSRDHYDASVIRRQAEQFSVKEFRNRLTGVVDFVLDGGRLAANGR